MGFTAIAQSSSYQNPSQMSLRAHLFSRPMSVPECKDPLYNARLNRLEGIIYRALRKLLNYVRKTNLVRAQEALENIVDTRSCSQSFIQREIDELNSLIGRGGRVQFFGAYQDDETYEVHLSFYEGEEEKVDDRIILRRSIAGRAQVPEDIYFDNCNFSCVEPLTYRYSISKPSLIAGLNFEIPQFVSQHDNSESEIVTSNDRFDSIPEAKDDRSVDQVVSQHDSSEVTTPNDRFYSTPEAEEDISVDQVVSLSNNGELVIPNYWASPISAVKGAEADMLYERLPPQKKDVGFEKWEQALNKPDQKLSLFGLSFEQIEQMPLKALRKSTAAKSMLFVSSSANKNQCYLNPGNLEILLTEQHRNSAICLKESINSVLKKLGIEVDGFTAKIMDQVPTECNWNQECISMSDNNQSDLTLLMHSIYTLRQIGFHALARSIAVAINNHRSKNRLQPFAGISRMAESPLICEQGTEYRKMYEIDAENENEEPTFSCTSDMSESSLIYAQWAKYQKMYEIDAENENEELTFSCISDMAESSLICAQDTEYQKMYEFEEENENEEL